MRQPNLCLVIILSAAVFYGSAYAQTVSTGCGIGYWKNHPQDWLPTGYSMAQSVVSVFAEAAAYADINAATLHEALSFHGGKGTEGGARLLVRQGVAALLNAAHPDISFQWSLPEVINSVNGALSSDDSKTMRELAESLDAANDRICDLKDQAPAVDIEKYTNGHNADHPIGPVIKMGDPVEWTYIVKNKGDVKLVDIQVSDDRIGTISCPKTELDPGESMTCTAQGTAVDGQYANRGTVTARSEQGQTVSDTDPSHYLGVESLEGEGCSLGYWKNHPDSWIPTGYHPDQLIIGIFIEAADYPEFLQATMMDALHFRGGPGVEGGARLLLRAATAALLNAAHPNIDFPLTEQGIISDVDAALASGARTQMLSLFEDLDYNIDLGCPLNEVGFTIREKIRSDKSKNKGGNIK